MCAYACVCGVCTCVCVVYACVFQRTYIAQQVVGKIHIRTN